MDFSWRFNARVAKEVALDSQNLEMDDKLESRDTILIRLVDIELKKKKLRLFPQIIEPPKIQQVLNLDLNFDLRFSSLLRIFIRKFWNSTQNFNWERNFALKFKRFIGILHQILQFYLMKKSRVHSKLNENL